MTSHLYLANSGLKKLPGMERLSFESIELNRNLLKSLEGLPRRIKKVDAGENYIRETGLYIPLPNLEELNLESNEIQLHREQDDFRLCFPSLQKLNIAKNTVLTCHFLRGTQLKELDIHRNYLKVLEHLPLTLERLDASINEVRMVQSRLPSSIQYVSLNNNFLAYAGLPLKWGNSLHTLLLDKNRIERFPKNLPDSLHTLVLSRNKISELPKKLPASLKVLNVSSNRIRSVPDYREHGVFTMFLVSNNCLVTLPDASVAKVLETDENWDLQKHSEAQRKIRKCWKRHVFSLRLRHFRRTNTVREELFSISMMPERCLQILSTDSQWLRRT